MLADRAMSTERLYLALLIWVAMALTLGSARAKTPRCTASLCAQCPCKRVEGRCRPTSVRFCGKAQDPATHTITCYKGRVGSQIRRSVFDLRPLACLTELRKLTLVSGELEFILTLRIDDLGPLAKLRRLEVVRLGHTTVHDLRPLANLVALRRLSLHSSPVRDLQPLARLVRLEHLDLSCTSVSDLRPLANLQRLERLDLTRTQVRDLRPLYGLRRLVWLGLSAKGPISASQRAELQRHRPKLTISVGRHY